MPLVPAPVYSAWFRRDSLVFRSFSYLFINPLWEKDIPNGFSLCPYAWCALFSFLIFRPLVYLTLALRGIARFLRLGRLIEWTDKVSPFDGPFGLPTVMGMTLLGLVGLLLSILGMGCVDLYSYGYLTVCILPIISFAACLFCYLHAHENRHNENRCKVEIYARVTLGLSVALIALNHPSLFMSHFLLAPFKIGAFIWGCTTGAAAWGWHGVGRLFHVMLAGFSSIWVGLLAMVALLVVGWVMERTMGKSNDGTSLPRKLTRKQIEVNLHAITRYIHAYSCINHHDFDSSQIRAAVDACPACRALAEEIFPIGDEACLPSLIGLVIAIANTRAAAERARIEGRSKACKRTTEVLAALCSPFVAVWKQVRIGASYAWALIKAFKGKNCPYLRFED